MESYQDRFLEFLLHSGALKFGEFTLKSGRKSPYFFNTGDFNDGAKISTLGEYYAAHLMADADQSYSVIFGPAYKGIPLAVTTAATLASKHKRNIGFSFNRKEAKEHGDGGMIVGAQLKSGDKVVIVEDVITAGTTLKEVVPYLQEQYKVEIHSVVIALDRAEKGSSSLSARQEAEQSLGIRVSPILTIHQIVSKLFSNDSTRYGVSTELKGKIESYLAEYGA